LQSKLLFTRPQRLHLLSASFHMTPSRAFALLEKSSLPRDILAGLRREFALP